MLYDCHVHTRHSGHSENYSLKDLKEEAEKKGVEFSIREHAPLPKDFFDSRRKNHFVPIKGRSLRDFTLHSGTLLPFFTEIAEQEVSLGFEVDIVPGFEKGTEEEIRRLGYDADYFGIKIDAINGSHHIYNGKYWDLSPEILVDTIKSAGGCRKFVRAYFRQIRDAMRTGFYDTISHLEFICRFNAPGSELESMFFKTKEIYVEELEKTFSATKECNVAIEYNTAGIDAKWKNPYLSGYALHFAYHYGIPLVIGSDAHAAKDLGRHFDFAVKQLKEYGIHKMHYFKERKRISYGI